MNRHHPTTSALLLVASTDRRKPAMVNLTLEDGEVLVQARTPRLTDALPATVTVAENEAQRVLTTATGSYTVWADAYHAWLAYATRFTHTEE